MNVNEACANHGCARKITLLEDQLRQSQGALHAMMEKHMAVVGAQADAEDEVKMLREQNHSLKEMISQLQAGHPPPQEMHPPQQESNSLFGSLRQALSTSFSPSSTKGHAVAMPNGAGRMPAGKESIQAIATQRIARLREEHDAKEAKRQAGTKLNYLSSPPGCEEADTAWVTEMVLSPNPKVVQAHLGHICRSKEHPIGQAIARFEDNFRSRMYPHSTRTVGFAEASEEVKLFIQETHHSLCTVFHAVLNTEESRTAALGPLETAVLGRLPLFDMCKGEGTEADERYHECLYEWQNVSAHELGIHARFTWALRNDRTGAGKRGEQARCGVFLPAVQCIRGLAFLRSPYDKVACIREACHLITLNAQDANGAMLGALMGADDIMPLLAFCIVQAEVPHLPSELAYADQLLLGDLADGEMGYFLACGNAALGRILSLAEHT